MAEFVLMCHPQRSDARALAADTATSLTDQGHQVVVPEGPEAPDELSQWFRPESALAPSVDLVISIGGDGTMLRAVGLAAPAGVPVLGVNVGHLGYLTQIEPEALSESLAAFLSGQHRVERRMTLEVSWTGSNGTTTLNALNEAVVQRSNAGHTVRLAVEVNGSAFTTYAADGLIVSTPTGSTAYNLSSRGPIVSPRHRALLLTPVSPHMLFDRSLVLDSSEVIDIVLIDDRPAELIVDGRAVESLEPGTRLQCRAGQHDALLVAFGARDFHQILKNKFGLADR